MSKQASEENKKLNRVEEKLKELSKCGLFLDNIFIKDKTARQILVSAYNKLERQQKEIMVGAEKVKQLEKEIKKYKRYFKLAISDLQSEGYMQMPYENIEKYYSKREDIV